MAVTTGLVAPAARYRATPSAISPASRSIAGDSAARYTGVSERGVNPANANVELHRAPPGRRPPGKQGADHADVFPDLGQGPSDLLAVPAAPTLIHPPRRPRRPAHVVPLRGQRDRTGDGLRDTGLEEALDLLALPGRDQRPQPLPRHVLGGGRRGEIFYLAQPGGGHDQPGQGRAGRAAVQEARSSSR
jgi:hypothetical protein